MALDYIRDPDRAHRETLARIRARVDLSQLPPGIAEVALRLIQASGDAGLLPDLAWSADLVPACQAALARGAAILTDSDLVAHGLIRARLPAANPVHCYLNHATARRIGRSQNITRAAAAVELWPPHLAGALVVIGASPSALFRLLELLDEGAPRPAVILAFPVGFVDATEAKQELARDTHRLPYLLLHGTRGGGSLATAALDALTGLGPPPRSEGG